MSEPQDVPTIGANQFSFRGFGRYYTDDDFISESPPGYALKEPLTVAPRKKKFHLLQEEIHQSIAPLALEEETTNVMQPQGMASLSGKGREGDQGGISVEEWVQSLELQPGKHRYLDHQCSMQRRQTDMVNDFQHALGEQLVRRRGSISMPSSPRTSPRTQRRPLPRRASANNLVEKVEAAMVAFANGHPGAATSEGDLSKSKPHSEIVTHSQASELVPSTGKQSSLVSRLAQFGPLSNKGAEAPQAEKEMAIASPPGPSASKGPFSMGFGRWLFTEKKNVQERDVNVFSPSTF